MATSSEPATDPQVYVVLHIRGDFAPAGVSAQLSMEPTRALAKGSPVGNGRSGRVHENALWLLSSDAEVSADTIEPHLEWLLDRLEPVATTIQQLRDDGHSATLNCSWASVGAGGGPWVTATTMSRLGALGLDLIVSFYATEPHL